MQFIKMMDLPKYPKFKTLKKSDYPTISKYISQFEPYSDFNEFSLYTNNIQETTEISSIYDNLIIKMRYYTDDRNILSILGKNYVDGSIHELLKTENSLELIPEVTVKCLKNKGTYYDVVEDIDNHDYILDLKKIANPQKYGLRNIKRKVNFWKKTFSSYIFTDLNLKSKKVQKEIIDLTIDWKKERKEKHIFDDTEAINLVFNHLDMFNLYSYGIYVDGVLMAFIICTDSSDPSIAMGQFGKSMPLKQGLFATLMYETSNILLEKGFLFMNYEQDLGLPGLRESKQQYKPVKILKKYKITKNLDSIL